MSIRFLVLVFISLNFCSAGISANIVAGFSSYKHVLDNNFEIKYTLIADADAEGSPIDEEIIVQVFTTDGAIYTHEANVRVFLSGTSNFDHGEFNDHAENNKLNFVYSEYIMDYSLFDPNKDYVFVHQRCCRSSNFINITNPGEAGISLTTTITSEAQALRNSSIEFEMLPSIIRSIDAEEGLDIQANSLDEDTLSYQLSPIFIGGGTDGINVGYAEACTGILPQGPCYPPYQQLSFNLDLSFFNPFPEWETASMDGQTGALLGTPSSSGHYVYGFTIHENRDGRIINSTSFDYLSIVSSLSTSTEAINTNKLKILGNPSHGKFYLDIGTNEYDRFVAFDMAGTQMDLSKNGNTGVIDLEIHGPPGVYVVKASDGKSTDSIKLIKL